MSGSDRPIRAVSVKAWRQPPGDRCAGVVQTKRVLGSVRLIEGRCSLRLLVIMSSVETTNLVMRDRVVFDVAIAIDHDHIAGQGLRAEILYMDVGSAVWVDLGGPVDSAICPLV